MVESTEEPEETSKLVAAGSPLPPRKRLLAGLKQNGWVSSDSVSSAYSVDQNCSKKLDFMSFSQCHGCGVQGSITGKDNKLQTLSSEWRVVLLCKNCFHGLDSGAICSYCFMGVSDQGDLVQGFNCCECDHWVHRGCVSKYRESLSRCESGSFLCVDCWVPKSHVNSNMVCRSRILGKVSGNCHSNFGRSGFSTCSKDEALSSVDKASPAIYSKNADRKPNAVNWERVSFSSNRIVSDSRSAIRSQFSVPGDCSRSLEEILKDANSAAEKAIKAAALAKERALKKAAAARKAAELARDALNLAAVVAEEEKGLKESLSSSASTVIGIGEAVLDRLQRAKAIKPKQDSVAESLEVVDDEALAFQLHRAMNSSPRIWKNIYFSRRKQTCHSGLQEESKNHLSKLGNSSHSVDTIPAKSESGSHSVCGKLEICTDDKLCETLDCPDAEPSVGIAAMNQNSSICLDVSEPNKIANVKMPSDTVFCSDEEHKKGPDVGDPRCCNLNGEPNMTQKLDPGTEDFGTVVENATDGIKGYISDSKNAKSETPMKEGQASCSNKVMGDEDSVDSGSESDQKCHGPEHKISSLGARESTCRRAKSSQNSSRLQIRSGVHCTPKLQKKRGHVSEQDSGKPNKRHSSMKAIIDRKTKSLSEDFPIDSQGSANMLPELQQTCSKASRTISHSSYRSPSVTLQASAYVSGPSGRQT